MVYNVGFLVIDQVRENKRKAIKEHPKVSGFSTGEMVTVTEKENVLVSYPIARSEYQILTV